MANLSVMTSIGILCIAVLFSVGVCASGSQSPRSSTPESTDSTNILSSSTSSTPAVGESTIKSTSSTSSTPAVGESTIKSTSSTSSTPAVGDSTKKSTSLTSSKKPYPVKTFNDTCDETIPNQCEGPLTCNSGHCSCADNTAYYDSTNKTCEKQKVFNESCQSGECQSLLRCYLDKCVCGPNLFYANSKCNEMPPVVNVMTNIVYPTKHFTDADLTGEFKSSLTESLFNQLKQSIPGLQCVILVDVRIGSLNITAKNVIDTTVSKKAQNTTSQDRSQETESYIVNLVKGLKNLSTLKVEEYSFEKPTIKVEKKPFDLNANIPELSLALRTIVIGNQIRINTVPDPQFIDLVTSFVFNNINVAKLDANYNESLITQIREALTISGTGFHTNDISLSIRTSSSLGEIVVDTKTLIKIDEPRIDARQSSSTERLGNTEDFALSVLAEAMTKISNAYFNITGNKPVKVFSIRFGGRTFKPDGTVCEKRNAIKPCEDNQMCSEGKNETAVCITYVKPDKDKTNLIIGLAVGLPGFLILLVSIAVLVWWKHRSDIRKQLSDTKMRGDKRLSLDQEKHPKDVYSKDQFQTVSRFYKGDSSQYRPGPGSYVGDRVKNPARDSFPGSLQTGSHRDFDPLDGPYIGREERIRDEVEISRSTLWNKMYDMLDPQDMTIKRPNFIKQQIYD